MSDPPDAPGPLQERTVTQAAPIYEEAPPAELVDKVLTNSYKRRVPGTGDMRHGSEGWHALETSCKVMLAVVLNPPCYHHHAITTMLSPPCYHHHAITTMLSSPYYHHHVITTMLSPPHYHHHAIITILSPPCYHHHAPLHANQHARASSESIP